MSNLRRRAPRRATSRVAVTAAVGAIIGSFLAALGPSSPASGATTVTPVEDGSPPVVRDSSVNVEVDVAALNYYRSSTSAAFAPTVPSAHVFNTSTCRGDNPAGTNNSPRTVLSVTDPNGVKVLDQTSPVRDMGLFSGPFTSPPYQPLAPQPGPNNTNYRGDFPASANTYHGMRATLDLTGRPAGVYTVTTINRNTVKTGLGACQVGTPGPLGIVVPGEQVETQTFVYRPWAHTFTDVLGNGRVRANVTPDEVQVTVGGRSSAVLTGQQRFYSLTGNSSFALPSDPTVCATNAASCLPATAEQCDPTSGCVPRLMIVNHPPATVDGQARGLQGIFDIETKAFIALAEVDGTRRVLMSLGPNDEYYRDVLASLSEQLASQGHDLPAILGTTVELRNGSSKTSLSLLNGLQIDPSSDAGGISLRSTGTVQAGVLLDIYSHLRLTGPACVSNSASSADGDRSYTANEDAGYKVRTSDLLPAVPQAGPLGALVGGPIWNITGDFRGTGTKLANAASAVIGVDTAADEPNGYPVWVQPFISSPMRVADPRTMDYLGTATWSASEGPIGTIGCLSVNFMVGTGVAVFDNPVNYGFDDLIDPMSAPNTGMRDLMTAVDGAVTDVTDLATANPVIAAVLEDLVGQLPLSTLP